MTKNKEITDLVHEVKVLLESCGLVKEANEIFLKDELVVSAIGQPTFVQKRILNRYWLLQLIRFGSESMVQRYCLVPDGTVEEWLKLFKDSVLPFAVSKSLPTKN